MSTLIPIMQNNEEKNNYYEASGYGVAARAACDVTDKGASTATAINVVPKPTEAGKAAASGGDSSTISIIKDLLYASCDQCRARKTKCNGERPCEACTLLYKRNNKIKDVNDVDLTKVECAYSPSKRRVPPKRNSPEKAEKGSGVRHKKKQSRHDVEGQEPVNGLRQVPGEVSSTAAAATEVASANDHNNAVTKCILDILGMMSLLGMMNPAISPSSGGLLQNHQAVRMPPQDSPLDPISASLLQVIFPSMMESTPVNNNLVNSMAQGQGVGGIHATASSNDAQQYFLQMLQLQLQQTQAQQLASLQQSLEQLQQPTAQQGLPTLTSLAAPKPDDESPLSSSSVEDGKTLSLRSQVEQLKSRVNNLEASNASLKQKMDSLEMKEKRRR